MNYSILSRTRGQLSQLNLLGGQIVVYDFSYTNQRNKDFPHAHPFHEFYYILGGKATLKVGNKKLRLKKATSYLSLPAQNICIFPKSPLTVSTSILHLISA
ncbi:MAG: cupin domain-containing protein [Lachnospiraceae bacterium]|nr:cupin domain-containing protein [Lachnospiraceae bacterium]